MPKWEEESETHHEGITPLVEEARSDEGCGGQGCKSSGGSSRRVRSYK
jgi:hypothetical protein